MILYPIDISENTLDRLLNDNEYIKECYRECNIVVLNKQGEKKDCLIKYDVLLTDYKLIFLNNAAYSAQSSKIPTRFEGGYFFSISSIIVNAISSSDSQDGVYLYIQLGDCEQDDKQDEEDNDFIEVNIYCLNENAVYSLFNSLSETVAFEEQIENSTDSQIHDDTQSYQDED